MTLLSPGTAGGRHSEGPCRQASLSGLRRDPSPLAHCGGSTHEVGDSERLDMAASDDEGGWRGEGRREESSLMLGQRSRRTACTTENDTAGGNHEPA
jgi:hypothetical protein